MQRALVLSSCSPRCAAADSLARRSWYGLSYSGFKTTALGAGGRNLGSDPGPPLYMPQTPVKSGGAAADWALTIAGRKTSSVAVEIFKFIFVWAQAGVPGAVR